MIAKPLLRAGLALATGSHAGERERPGQGLPMGAAGPQRGTNSYGGQVLPRQPGTLTLLVTRE